MSILFIYPPGQTHMCPKDFTIDCIINTVLVLAPLFMR